MYTASDDWVDSAHNDTKWNHYANTTYHATENYVVSFSLAAEKLC